MIPTRVVNVPNPRTGISLPSRNYEKSAVYSRDSEKKHKPSVLIGELGEACSTEEISRPFGE